MSGQDGESVTAAFDGSFDASTFRFRPRSPMPVFGRRERVLRRVLLSVVVVHLFVLTALVWPPGKDDAAASDSLQVEFVVIRDPEPPMPPPSPRSRTQQQPQPRPQPRPPSTPPPSAPRAPAAVPPTASTALQAVEIAPAQPTSSAALFDDQGRIVVPQSALDDLRRNTSDDRVFDYQVAGLAKARTAFTRRPPLEYDRSRFEDGMVPTQDMLTELLSRAVEASTVSISIPIPGDPYRRIECKVIVLAAGGACGMTGFTGYVEEDDPDTLDPEEQKQCAAWWEKITTTNAQDAWLETRALYDANCRKPPERDPRRTRPPVPDDR